MKSCNFCYNGGGGENFFERGVALESWEKKFFLSAGCFWLSVVCNVKIFVYIMRYSFLASGIFVFDEIFGVWFFKKQEFCHFEPFAKRRKIHLQSHALQ